MVNFLFPSNANASEIDNYEQYAIEDHHHNFGLYGFIPDAEEEISLMLSAGLIPKTLNPDQEALYEEKLKYHKMQAIICYNDAQNKCWYLPNVADREKAKQCYVIAFAAFAPADPKYKLISLILATLAAYGLDCINEWDYINNKLACSKYHYEMVEWYEHVLANG